MKYLILFCLIFSSQTLLAQNTIYTTTVTTNENAESITQLKSKNATQGLGITTYKGSILLYDHYVSGTFKVEGGKQMTAPLMLDVLDNELIAMIEGERRVLKNTDFSIDNHRFVYLKGQYYELIYEGEVSLLKLNECWLTRNHNYITDPTQKYAGEFFQKESYRYLLKDGKIREFNLNKDSIVFTLKPYEYNLAEYLYYAAPEIKSVEELIKLLENRKSK